MRVVAGLGLCKRPKTTYGDGSAEKASSPWKNEATSITWGTGKEAIGSGMLLRLALHSDPDPLFGAKSRHGEKPYKMSRAEEKGGRDVSMV